MKTAFIGDVQDRPSVVAEVLANPPAERVVFLGDYLDSFHHADEAHIEALELVLGAAERGECIALIGNHEWSYLSGEMRCSGYRDSLARVVPKDRMRRVLRPFWWDGERRVLATHAGLTRSVVKQLRLTEDGDPSELLKIEYAKMPRGAFGWIGRSRGGPREYGGPLWCDWSEFTISPHFRQVVGHTRGPAIREHGDNWCADVLAHHREIVVLEEDGSIHASPLTP